jgi:hypothetical protein
MDDDLTELSFPLFVRFIQTFIVSRRRDNCQVGGRKRERDKAKVTAVAKTGNDSTLSLVV